MYGDGLTKQSDNKYLSMKLSMLMFSVDDKLLLKCCCCVWWSRVYNIIQTRFLQKLFSLG